MNGLSLEYAGFNTSNSINESRLLKLTAELPAIRIMAREVESPHGRTHASRCRAGPSAPHLLTRLTEVEKGNQGKE